MAKEGTETKKNIGVAMAAFLGSGAAIFLVGLFQLLTEASEIIKAALTVHSGIGPLSGKVLYGYSLGLLVFLIAFIALRRKKDGRIEPYLYYFIIMLILGSLLTFTPFTDFILGK